MGGNDGAAVERGKLQLCDATYAHRGISAWHYMRNLVVRLFVNDPFFKIQI